MKKLDVDKEEVMRRLAELRPDSTRQWGKMSCHQMIVYLSDSFLLPLGERKASKTSVPIPRGIYKWGALYFPMKWPHGVKTMPEMQQGVGGTAPVEFSADREKLVGLIGRFCGAPVDGVVHPIFGAMTEKDWQRWGLLALRSPSAAVWGVRWCVEPRKDCEGKPHEGTILTEIRRDRIKIARSHPHWRSIVGGVECCSARTPTEPRQSWRGYANELADTVHLKPRLQA
jgi:hypothetical protein